MIRNEKSSSVSKIRVATGVMAIIGGVALFVYAGIDDSPGGQLLGVMLVFFGIYRSVKSRK